jgi:malto-oligosyltrehalose synthase/4-alpha-glucanotransferase
MYNPVSTYRIQFNKDFTFTQFIDHIGYFSKLGIVTIYASPIFKSAPGSLHGYDITDPNMINPAIGSDADFEEIVSRLKKLNIGWLQDIVPNHMAVHYDNRWLMDVLEHGRHSEYASFFDIDFDHPAFNGKIFLPFLGRKTEDAVEMGEITFGYKELKPVFKYFDSCFPVNEESLISIFRKESNAHFQKISDMLKKHDQSADLQTEVSDAINADITRVKELLTVQNYKLAHWKEVEQHLNYRRFFTISSLICLRMENEAVFQNYHSMIAGMVKKNMFQGLRIDHIDGLRNPSDYIDSLRFLAGDETYIIAEKILESNEELPLQWPLQGTSGYDFMAMVNNLLTYRNNYAELRDFYNELTGSDMDPEEIIYEKKKLILTGSMQGDLDNLGRLFIESGFLPSGNDPEVTPETIREAIGEFLLACPRYKLYSDHFPLSDDESAIVRKMLKGASERAPLLSGTFDILRELFLDQESLEPEKKKRALNFFQRCMQFTGPLLAKGQEDTAMYSYNCFIAHNEVGDNIDARGIINADFHELMLKRMKRMPLSINATSTHDTKRGEDVRARLAVISELSGLWIKNVNHWIILNKNLKEEIGGKAVPDANEEYFIYQTLTGVLPFNDCPGVINRINEYIIKSLREAKVNSDWDNPDEDYEKAVIEFVARLLSSENIFLNSFLPLQKKIAQYGILNSLVQVTLKATCPGIPDFYQGTELWDLSMVDPDNRRPVNYQILESTLKKLLDGKEGNLRDFLLDLYSRKEDGEIKMWLTHLLLQERLQNPDLFIYGEYIPLEITGRYRENILAFTRSYKNEWYVVIIPLHTAMLNEKQDSQIINWGDTIIELPELSPENWTSIFSSGKLITDGFIHVSEILKIPIPCVLKGSNAENRRKAGILMHISSLPGAYGSGDIGKEAYKFIDFLHAAGQSYWQILPVNPVSAETLYSPYSTYSALAGNLMLIDPEWLLRCRLISEENLHSVEFNTSDLSDFEKAEGFRINILDTAFSNYIRYPEPYMRSKFESFCKKENYWLDDYALYMILKNEFKKPWYNWPVRLREREAAELNHYKKKFSVESEKHKFFQFIFYNQWHDLKKYANMKGVRIIGDMSFYVSYDSVDVWQHPEFFKLDPEKRMTGVGGAPPDYFSKTGQLWNMPVYDWEVLKREGYAWWTERIRKNMEWFNLVRFDHFRGFSSFWEVPADEKDAVNGRWMEGPGNDFFLHLKKNFPGMPFIAEDLGEIDNKVYDLRDKFHLPGMRVLQFAFNDAMERSIHLPHNYNENSIVYTGTHDNNTTRGWYEQELPTKFRIRVDEYTNKKLNGSTISEEFIRLAYSSVAQIAIIPVQDIIGLGQSERLNNPLGSEENWKWKLRSLDRVSDKARYLRKLVKLFWRI